MKSWKWKSSQIFDTGCGEPCGYPHCPWQVSKKFIIEKAEMPQNQFTGLNLGISFLIKWQKSILIWNWKKKSVQGWYPLKLLFCLYLLQLSDTEDQELPPFPPAKDLSSQQTVPPSGGTGGGNPDTGPILPVPVGIRPTLVKYRFEVNWSGFFSFSK